MFRALAAGRGRDAPVGPLALLLVALLSATLLGWEAWRAQVARRDATHRGLNEYATFASAQFADRMVRGLVDALATAWRLPDEPPPRARAAAGALAALRVRGAAPAWCRCLDSVRVWFAVPLGVDGVPTGPPVGVSPDAASGARDGARAALGAAEREWVAGAVTTRGREFAGMLAAIRRVDRSATVADATIPTAARSPLPEVALYFPRIAGRQQAVVFAIAVDAGGDPLAAYGFLAEPRAFLTPLVTRLLRGQGLLPAAVVHGLPNDSVVVVRLADDAGRTAYASVPAAPSRYGLSDYATTDTLSRQPGALRFRIALRADAVPRLAVPGPSDARLGAVAGLFVLSVGGALLAIRRLRRTSALAAARTAFVSGVSHELRTPLTQIRLFAELLQEPALKSDEHRLRWARIIDQEARRLGFLVENVLSFARAERHGLRVTPQATDAASVLAEVRQAFAPLAAARGVTITSDVAPDTPRLWADPTALRHVLLNLLDNAVKYGPEGQTVTVRLAPQLDGFGRGARRALLAVEDEGPGIPRESRDRIWAPYERLRPDGAVGGSGIGLAVVRELVRLHDGDVRVEDAPRGGARFVVALPIATARPTSDERSDAPRDVVQVAVTTAAARVAPPSSDDGHSPPATLRS